MMTQHIATTSPNSGKNSRDSGGIQHLSGGLGAEILVPLAMSRSAYVYVYDVISRSCSVVESSNTRPW